MNSVEFIDALTSDGKKNYTEKLNEITKFVESDDFNPYDMNKLGLPILQELGYLYGSSYTFDKESKDYYEFIRNCIDLVLKAILRKHPDAINFTDITLDTPLHLFCKYECLSDFTQKIIDCRSTNLNVINDIGRTPVLELIRYGNLKNYGYLSSRIFNNERYKLQEYDKKYIAKYILGQK